MGRKVDVDDLVGITEFVEATVSVGAHRASGGRLNLETRQAVRSWRQRGLLAVSMATDPNAVHVNVVTYGGQGDGAPESATSRGERYR